MSAPEPRILAGPENNAAQARKDLRESLIATSPVFDAKPFFMSEELSLVDCAVTPLLWRFPALDIELPPQAKSVRAYAKRMFQRDAFHQSLSEYEEELVS